VLVPESGRINVALTVADRAADALIALREAGVGIVSVSVAKPTLDEVFLAITGHDAGQRDEEGGDDITAHDEPALEVAQ
jgi:ABC-2 type transport system ATP-binding protein